MEKADLFEDDDAKLFTCREVPVYRAKQKMWQRTTTVPKTIVSTIEG